MDGITVCADCGTALVNDLPPEEPDNETIDDIELVTILESTDIATLTIAKSILDEAAISYMVKGELAMDVYPVGPFSLRVDAKDEAKARELLEALNSDGQDYSGDIEFNEDNKPE